MLMYSLVGRALQVGLGLAAVAVLVNPATAENHWPSISAQETESAQRIREELRSPTQVDFIETPLTQTIEFLADRHGIPIVMNRRALDDVGLDPDTTTVTRSIKGIMLLSALNLILAEHQLGYVIQDEVLMITTKEQADEAKELRVYDVTALVAEKATVDELAMTLTQVLASTHQEPGMMGMPGGMMAPGGGMPLGVLAIGATPQIRTFRNTLIVNDTHEGHRKLGGLLAAIAKATAPEEATTATTQEAK